MKLNELHPGDRVRVLRVASPASGSGPVTRLMELGLIPGASVEVLHEAPFGGDPMAVRVRGTLIALRRAEAQWVEVEKS